MSYQTSNVIGLVDSIIRHFVTPRDRTRRWHSLVVLLSRLIHFLVIDLTPIPKLHTIHELPTEPITGLGFREPTSSSVIAETQTNANMHDKDKDTTSRVLSYQASGHVVGSNPSIVNEVGTGLGLGCAAMDWRKRNIVVAREEGVWS